jgi:hypothetical protein
VKKTEGKYVPIHEGETEQEEDPTGDRGRRK